MVQILSTIIPVLVILLGGIGWLYKNEIEKRRQIEKQLSEKKYDVYNRLMDIFFYLLKQVKKNKDISVNDPSMIDKMLDIKKDLIIYASDDVFKSYYNWLINCQKSTVLITFAQLLISIRKDMGNPYSKITSDEFLISLIQNEEEYETLKKNGFKLKTEK
jgi:hypothetical protein